MKIGDLVKKDNLLYYPSKDFTLYSGRVEGDVNGECIEFFENGKIASIINYKKKIMFGSYKTFFCNGNIKEEGIVFEDKWNGPFSNYYENGI